MKTVGVVILAVLIVTVTSRIQRYRHKLSEELSDEGRRYQYKLSDGKSKFLFIGIECFFFFFFTNGIRLPLLLTKENLIKSNLLSSVHLSWNEISQIKVNANKHKDIIALTWCRLHSWYKKIENRRTKERTKKQKQQVCEAVFFCDVSWSYILHQEGADIVYFASSSSTKIFPAFIFVTLLEKLKLHHAE